MGYGKKLGLAVFSLAFFVAAGVCTIVDMAVNGGITWAAYPLWSLAFTWLCALPMFFKKPLLSLLVFSAAVPPYLYALEAATGGRWFAPLALPIAAMSLGVLWLTWLLKRFTGMDICYALAVAVFLFGAVVSTIIKYMVDARIDPLDIVINVFSAVTAAAGLCIGGYGRTQHARKAAADKAEEIKP